MEKYSYGHFYYHAHEGYVSICGYLGQETDIEIPSSISGKPVSEIESGSFENCNSIETIVVPDTVMMVYADSFTGAGALKKIISRTKDITIEAGAGVTVEYKSGDDKVDDSGANNDGNGSVGNNSTGKGNNNSSSIASNGSSKKSGNTSSNENTQKSDNTGNKSTTSAAETQNAEVSELGDYSYEETEELSTVNDVKESAIDTNETIDISADESEEHIVQETKMGSSLPWVLTALCIAALVCIGACIWMKKR